MSRQQPAWCWLDCYVTVNCNDTLLSFKVVIDIDFHAIWIYLPDSNLSVEGVPAHNLYRGASQPSDGMFHIGSVYNIHVKKHQKFGFKWISL